MFDIGFAEIVLVMVIALLVVGPERLPRLARTAGLWLGKARAFVQSVREDVERELAAEELKRVMDETGRIGEELGQVREIIEETDSELRQATAAPAAGAAGGAPRAPAGGERDAQAPAALSGEAGGGDRRQAGDGSADGGR